MIIPWNNDLLQQIPVSAQSILIVTTPQNYSLSRIIADQVRQHLGIEVERVRYVPGKDYQESDVILYDPFLDEKEVFAVAYKSLAKSS